MYICCAAQKEGRGGNKNTTDGRGSADAGVGAGAAANGPSSVQPARARTDQKSEVAPDLVARIRAAIIPVSRNVMASLCPRESRTSK